MTHQLAQMQGVFDALHYATTGKEMVVNVEKLGMRLGEHLWPDQFAEIAEELFGANTPASNHCIKAAMSIFEMKMEDEHEEMQDGYATTQYA